MKSSFSARSLFLKLLLGLTLSMLLAACGSLGQAGTSTSVTLHSDGPMAPLPPTPQPTVATGTMSRDYAFVKNGQIWLSLHGGAPQQATKLSIDPQLNSPFYNNFLWLDHDQYLAFTLAVRGGGLGCGGCFCGLRYYYGAQLFVLNTNTLQLSSPKITGQTDPQKSTYQPYLGYWNKLIKEGETHILGWNTDGFSQNGGPLAGLYELDLTSGTLKLKIAAANMPNLNFSSTMNNLAYSDGKVYYAAVTNAGGYDEHFVILSHSLDDNTSTSTKVTDIGTESLCFQGATTQPADAGWVSGGSWAISPDGKTLAVQVMTSPSNGYMSSKVEKINLSNGQATTISQSLTPNELYWDITLTWSPDSLNMTLLGIDQPADRSTDGSSILSTCNSQNQLQQYQMNTPGEIFWQDNVHFLLVIVTSDGSNYTNGVKLVQYVVGTPTGVQLPGMTISIASQFTVGEGV